MLYTLIVTTLIILMECATFHPQQGLMFSSSNKFNGYACFTSIILFFS